MKDGCTKALVRKAPPHRYCGSIVNPFKTAVPFWGQNTRNLSSLSQKRDCGSKRGNGPRHSFLPRGRVPLFESCRVFFRFEMTNDRMWRTASRDRSACTTEVLMYSRFPRACTLVKMYSASVYVLRRILQFSWARTMFCFTYIYIHIHNIYSIYIVYIYVYIILR